MCLPLWVDVDLRHQLGGLCNISDDNRPATTDVTAPGSRHCFLINK